MKIRIFDIETLLENFLVIFYNPKNNEYRRFSIDKWRDEGDALLKYLEEEDVDYYVGYNNINFDGQVIEYVQRFYREWADLSNLTICKRIAKFAQDRIDDSNNDVKPKYWESELKIKHIDLFRIHHFDNEAKRTSLKWLEFMMDMPSIEDMPIHHLKENLTREEIRDIENYCVNDVMSTYRVWLYTIGEVEHEEYKGKNKIQDRLDTIDEYKFTDVCLSWSDVKIGDAINMQGYCNLTGKTPRDVYDMKKRRGATKKITFGDCIPSYVQFQTKEFKDFYDSVRKEKVSYGSDDQEFPFTYNGTKYMIARGGIHSIDPKRFIIPQDNEILRDADVGSQYPNAIVKRELYPSHLGVKWLVNYKATIDRRIEYKKLGKNSLKYKGLSEMLKLALNGGGFGKTNEVNSWQYDPVVTYKCTIGNQFEMLMLIESLELIGVHCISANTDGIVCLFTKDKEKDYNKICNEWEVKVGNSESGKLEFADFKGLYQLSVNNYIAVKSDGTFKKKGRDFSTVVSLNRDKSGLIIPISIEQYYKNGVALETTIKNHKNIFDFCIAVKATYNYHYASVNMDTSKMTFYNKIIRYIMTTNGERLIKVKREGSEATGPQTSHCEAPDKNDGRQWLGTVVNVIDETKPINTYSIDYEYYIRKAKDIISLIEKNKKQGRNNPNQIKLNF